MCGRSASVIVFLWVTVAAAASPESFATRLYPVLDKAGCKNCHHADGIASATRLHFPLEGASAQVVDAFGNSLVELVDRVHPEKSLLWNKPTNRIKHTGGERIKKGSAEEALLLDWVNHLASLSDAEARRALSFRAEELGRAGKPIVTAHIAERLDIIERETQRALTILTWAAVVACIAVIIA